MKFDKSFRVPGETKQGRIGVKRSKRGFRVDGVPGLDTALDYLIAPVQALMSYL